MPFSYVFLCTILNPLQTVLIGLQLLESFFLPPFQLQMLEELFLPPLVSSLLPP